MWYSGGEEKVCDDVKTLVMNGPMDLQLHETNIKILPAPAEMNTHDCMDISHDRRRKVKS